MISSAQWSGKGADTVTRSDAPADNGASNTQPNTPNPRLNLQSCQFCRKRKIKCDKLEGGCSQCSRAQTECIYPASQRKGRPRKAGANRAAPAPTPREAQLLKRIWKLERLVVNMAGGNPPLSTGGSVGSVDHIDADEDGSFRAQLGRLVIGKSYLNDTFWSNQLSTDDLEDSEEESNDEDEDEDALGVAPRRFPEVFPANFIFDVDQTANLRHFHPPPSQVQTYWRLYRENCEVLIRLFHAPTTSKIVDQAQADFSSLSRSHELVMFAIYFATITSMSQEDVLTELGGDKTVLLSQYQMAVQKAMVNASFLNTQDLAVLQAFVLYLVSIRHSDGAAVWTMTGLAIRIAHGMGIDRDGELFKLSPLEVELRRRVWHQISLLDLRSSEARGVFPTHLSYDTKLPLNINDSDLSPETKTYPEPRAGLTDMTAALVRLEFCDVTRRLHKTSSMAVKEALIDQFRQSIETNFIKYCLNGGPFELWCTRLARLIMNRMILMLFKREKNLSPTTRERLFLTSIDVVDLANQLRRDEYTRRWDWLIRTYMQWHALAVILSELSEQPSSGVTERAWKVIDEIDWEEPEDRAGRILSQSIKRLLAKAQAHKASQSNPPLACMEHPEDAKSPSEEPLFPPQGSFDPALLGQEYHAPTNFVNVEDHHPHQFYVPQHASPHGISQQPAGTWYYDSSIHQQDQEVAYNAGYWKWGARDDAMQRGTG